MSPVLNLFAVIVPAELISPTVIVPSTIKSFVMCKSLFGIKISPYCVALNSKFELLNVVVIKFVSTLISSNCAAPETVTLPVISKLPVKSILPV